MRSIVAFPFLNNGPSFLAIWYNHDLLYTCNCWSFNGCFNLIDIQSKTLIKLYPSWWTNVKSENRWTMERRYIQKLSSNIGEADRVFPSSLGVGSWKMQKRYPFTLIMSYCMNKVYVFDGVSTSIRTTIPVQLWLINIFHILDILNAIIFFGKLTKCIQIYN